MTEYIHTPEDKARHKVINPMLKKAGWIIQDFKNANIRAAKGIAVEYFHMGQGVGEADYVLFVNGIACGIIEAKKEGETLTGKEIQSSRYAEGFPEQFKSVPLPLPFVYETSGSETHFTNLWDPKPQSRAVFSFHRPETCENWLEESRETFRKRLSTTHELNNDTLWPAQKIAIINTESSLALWKPKSLLQMATGSGKTYTAVNICYRLLKNAKAKRILFLVDRGNLGEQTETEFQKFTTPDDGRKFTEIYGVQRLTSNFIDSSSKVCISTIQRVYSMLRGEELDESAEERSGFETGPDEMKKVEYNEKIPIEEFDIVIVDECHRSIYNQWKQVLDYFDSFLLGLTATPSMHTIGFFNQNMVMEYGHEAAVADGVNVDFGVYRIKTKITEDGSTIDAGTVIQKRDKRTRRKRWETLEEAEVYDSSKLDRSVVATNQIRTIVRTFKDKLFTEIFPGRTVMPKTLIFAKDDNHAEEIVQIVREEFGESNKFAVKITYKTEGETPKNLIQQFRNSFYPRIAVTVDMIATGTDIKPLEVVFFMRDIHSSNYFEQMKGRGVRVIPNDDFKAVTPDAMAKDHFIIVDAVGVTDADHELSESKPLEQKLGVSFEKLLQNIRYGDPTDEDLSSMASRLSRLQKKLNDTQKAEIEKLSGGADLKFFAKLFVEAINPDNNLTKAREKFGDDVTTDQLNEVCAESRNVAITEFLNHGELLTRLPEIKKETEVIIDNVSVDEVLETGFSEESTEKAKQTIQSFEKFIEENKDELTIIQAFYNNKNLKYSDLKEMVEKIRTPPYSLTSPKLWSAYKQLEDGKVHGSAKGKPVDFVSLLRFELGKDETLEPYVVTVNERFSNWLSKQKAMGVSFSQEQLNWLEKIKEHISESVEITTDDFELGTLAQMGGLGKAHQVFGDRLNGIIEELNELSV
ncbi:DEAD/DEAH box helicase family protein [Candidatus Woesearchaeota archaeon]|nr:DEAD/DEAH box helicase family protein [Candidatus Woesearchaeota archaeon]